VYGITGPGGRLEGLVAAVEIEGKGRIADGVTVQVDVVPDGALIRCVYRNPTDGPVRVRRLYPLIYGAKSHLTLQGSEPGADGWGVWKQGYQSWSYAGHRPLDAWDVTPRSILVRSAHADPTWKAPQYPGRFQSESLVMLGRPGAPAILLAGFVSARRMFGRLELTSGNPLGALEAWCEADGLELQPGESLEAEPLLVLMAPEHQALEAYATRAAAAMEARVPDQVPAVWCSWYYYFTKVAEADVLKAATALATVRETHPVNVIQLDDGYQTAVGDWFSLNKKFPSGLDGLARQIREAGFTPGLWVAPFIALRKSKLFREHPDWFVKTAKGKPKVCGWNPGWGDIYYALDTTHPEVEAWLTDLFRRLVAAGYTYLKLDFLYGACMAGVRHDPRATRVEAFRRGMAIIRQAVGEAVYLLGCGSPMLPAVGLVDAMRVGPDVAPHWRFKFWGLPILGREPGTAAARNALVTAMGRQWMHGRFWVSDPDSMILRSRQSGLSVEEARTIATLGGLSGGIPSFSDPPALLDAGRKEWLRRLLPPVAGGLQPFTYLGEAVPFLSTVKAGEWLLLFACNGGEEARRLRVDPAALGSGCLGPGAQSGPGGAGSGPLPAPVHAYDCWGDRYLGCFEGPFDAGEVPPHGCRVLALRAASPDGVPAVVGSTFHLSPANVAALSRWDGQVLTIALRPGLRGMGTITIAPAAPRVEIPGASIIEQRQGEHGEQIIAVRR
jgi:alpha-galactosidase